MNDHLKSDILKTPDKKYRPDIRWWLAEGMHTHVTLKNEMSMLDESGFGAIEFLAMDEPGADSALYGWGSEEWVHDSQLLVAEATQRSMGVSMTSGTNWSNANLTTITPDDKAAAKELNYVTELVKAGKTRSGEIPRAKTVMPNVHRQDLEAAVAVRKLGETDGKQYLDKDSFYILTDNVTEGQLSWTAPADGDYLLFYFWIHGTGQTAGPSVSTSYTVNYIDCYGAEAVIDYWGSEILTPKLQEDLFKNGRGMMYMDSLELSTFGAGGQFWGYHFLDEFRSRRGYDLTPYLPFIVKDGGMMCLYYHYHYFMEDEVFAEKLHNDVYQTMTDLYMDNMLKPLQEWLHTVGMTLRAEISYGLPFEISQPGKYVDGIETESLEFASQIEPYRNLAGPAHIYNRTYSSETGATMLNYMMGMDFYTQIIFTQFAAGVTKTVLHGYASIAGSEESTYWPGHEGMWPVFSERFGSRQPSYQHYQDWTGMITRFQMLLRQGKPRMDLGFLRLDYNFNNLYFTGKNEKELYEHDLMRGNEGVFWKDMKLQNSGYTWDYFAPQILEEDFVDFSDGELLHDGPGYQALIIYQTCLPLSSARKLCQMAKKGLPILFVNGVTETTRPFSDTFHAKAAAMTPFNDGMDRELERIINEMKSLPNVRELDGQADVYEALISLGIRPRTEFAEENKNILTLLREEGSKTYFYAYNMMYTEDEPFSFTVSVRGEGKPYKIDCWNGEITEPGYYKKAHGNTVLDLKLAPGEACLYVIDMSENNDLHAVTLNPCHESLTSDSVSSSGMSSGCYTLTKENGRFLARVFESGEYSFTLQDGSLKSFSADVPDNIPIPLWDLSVEDWNEGDKVTITEDRGLGIVTKEVYYETTKDLLHADTVSLKPWKDIPRIGPEVSGVGYYTARVTLPSDWSEANGAVLEIGSVNGNTAAIYVNGHKAGAVNMQSLQADISEWLIPGENTILVEVSSTLNNRLLARGYFDLVEERTLVRQNNASNSTDTEDGEGGGLSFNISSQVHDYGMTGDVSLKTYTRVFID